MRLCTKNYKDFTIVDENDVAVKSFSGAKLANKALPGDKVEPTETGCKLVERANHPMLAGLIELNSKTKYGFTSRNKPIFLFCPFNESYPPFVVGCGHDDTSVNRLALVKFDAWQDTLPRGNLQRLLDIGADEEALFWNYTPLACEKYKGPLLAEDQSNSNSQSNKPLIQAFNIDPPDCRDVDDVLTIDTQDGKTFVTITISDVAAQVPQGHPLDLRAQQIGQTLYQDGNKPRHVFPQELSEDRLSLLTNTIRPGLSLKFPLHDPTQVTWFESLVQTTKSYTYESVYNDPTLCEQLKILAQALGEPTDDSHVWIEVAMKFYNVEAAKILRKQKAGFLRCHDKPNEERLSNLTKINPDLKFLAFSSAIYTHADTISPFHYGLQTPYYTHATSPIRRYADLVNQRIIKAYINKEQEQEQQSQQALNPNHLNYVAKQAKRHDRDLVFIRALRSNKEPVDGQILELKQQDQETKLTIYVPTWELTVKLRYKTGATPDIVMSKDETTQHTVHIGKHVTLSYYADMTARSWKKRMVLRLL